METLDGTSWDIVISGTGLQQSLLALYACLLSTVLVATFLGQGLTDAASP